VRAPPIIRTRSFSVDCQQVQLYCTVKVKCTYSTYVISRSSPIGHRPSPSADWRAIVKDKDLVIIHNCLLGNKLCCTLYTFTLGCG
jgi:hypothetical protein